MSQSKSAYGVQNPKGTANEHCQSQSQNTNATDRETVENPEPACWRRRVDGWEWHETEYTAAFLGIYDPCPECFDGPPDADELDTVVRSCSYPTSYHRVADPAETNTREAHATTETETTETLADWFDDGDQRSIDDITEFKRGDGVVWQGQSTPLLVVGPAGASGGTVSLRGPNGGEYSIKGRPNHSRSHAVYPGIGVVADMRRVVSPDVQPLPEAV